MKGTFTQDIADIERYIKVNNLKEVTNPVIMNHTRYPTDDGLLSFEIFGRSQLDRLLNWAWIDLKEPFIHPYLFKVLSRLEQSATPKICAGIGKFYLDENGYIKEDTEGDEKIKGGTGIKFLYDNFDKLEFKKTKSAIRGRRIKLIKSMKKKDMFVTKWLVIPAFYRDMNFGKTESRDSVHEITEMYANLIRLVKFVENESKMGLDVITNGTRFKIQKCLADIYDFATKGNIASKKGKFRQSVLGKSVDYGARLVISAPTFHLTEMDDNPINMQTSGVPLSAMCSTFYPYVFKWIRDFFDRNLLTERIAFEEEKTGSKRYVKVKDYEKNFSNDYIKKNIKSFVNSYHDRFRPIPIEYEDGTVTNLSFVGRFQHSEGESSAITNRAMTWTDLIYMACHEVAKNKHIVITRYPLEDYFGIFPSKIHILSTRKTMPAFVGGKYYSHYPVIDVDMKSIDVSTYFIDTLQMSNLYLKGLGGDYDGDQVSIRGVFSQEANAELHKKIMSKSNIVNINGQNMRKSEREAIQAFFDLTKGRKNLKN